MSSNRVEINVEGSGYYRTTTLGLSRAVAQYMPACRDELMDIIADRSDHPEFWLSMEDDGDVIMPLIVLADFDDLANVDDHPIVNKVNALRAGVADPVQHAVTGLSFMTFHTMANDLTCESTLVRLKDNEIIETNTFVNADLFMLVIGLLLAQGWQHVSVLGVDR